MDSRYIAAAIPLFFLMIGAELLLSRRRGARLHAYHDAIANLSCGVGQQVISLFYKGLALLGYVWVYQHGRVYTVSERSVVGWLVLIFALDACYYWFHRASHRVNLLWAAHVVHHQSEEYNLTVALRQSWFGGLVAWPFYLPLAIAGFSPAMYLTMTTLNTLYQFWIHTRLVGRMGVLEWFLNTPSHHRVHHGIDPKYIDKNYAGMFIVWDKLFGTFEPESSEPVYGIVKPLRSFNPGWANVEYFAVMGAMMRGTRSLRDRLLVPLMPPEWRPSDLGGPVNIPEVTREAQEKYERQASRAIDGYVLGHFVLVVVATTVFILAQGRIPEMQLAAIGALIVGALLGWGALVEGRAWGLPFEALRLLCLLAVAVWVTHGTHAQVPSVLVSVLLCTVSLVFLLRARSRPATGAAFG